MRRLIKRSAIVIGCLSAGAVFGPVLIAAVAAAVSPASDAYGVSLETSKLIDAYQDRLPPNHLFLTVVSPEDGAECGYDSEEVFPDGMERMMQALQSDSYVDYEGYYALDRWRNQNRDDDWVVAVSGKLDEDMTAFEAGFLRRCIESTVFASLCMKSVEQFGHKVPRFNSEREHYLLAAGDEDRVVCTFVDGVAARRGIELSDQPAAGD